MTLVDRLLEGLLNGIHGTECVCNGCVQRDDVVIGRAGDFSLCARCRESITSKTGKQIRKTPQGR